ncbi:hypothetical protein P7K49_030909, partial [Saguinus oedipus]
MPLTRTLRLPQQDQLENQISGPSKCTSMLTLSYATVNEFLHLEYWQCSCGWYAFQETEETQCFPRVQSVPIKLGNFKEK